MFAGIFRSLLHKQEVSDKDVDAAINAICEESQPQETDLTHYMHNVCGHVRKVIKKAMLEQVIREDLMKTLPKSADLTLSPGSQDSQYVTFFHGVALIISAGHLLLYDNTFLLSLAKLYSLSTISNFLCVL